MWQSGLEEYSEEEYSSDKSYQIFNVITNALKGIKSKTPSSKIKGANDKGLSYNIVYDDC